MASALDKLVSNKEGPDTFDYVVIISRSSASMKVTYLMVDHDTHTLAPKVMMVKWPRFMDIVDFRACVLKNVLYITGGKEKSTGKYLKQVLRYDPNEGRWKECNNMRKARANHTATVLNGRIYVTGGCESDKELLDSCESYEPMTDEWQKEEPLLSARKDHTCVVKDSTLYLCGGTSKTETACDNLWYCQRTTDQNNKMKFKWHQMKDSTGIVTLTYAATNNMAVVYKHKLFMVGGKICKKFQKYYPDPNDASTFEYEWHKCTGPNFASALEIPSCKHMAVMQGSSLMVIGGMANGYKVDGKGFVTAIEENGDQQKEYKRMLGTSDTISAYRFQKKQSIVEQQSKPKEVKKPAAKQSDHVHAPNCPQSQEFKAKKRWVRNLPDMPQARCGGGLVSLGHKIYIIGGHRIEEPEISNNIVQFYHTKKETWYTSFDLGEGDFRSVDCVLLSVPRTNKDFRPMRYSDCKWVLW